MSQHGHRTRKYKGGVSRQKKQTNPVAWKKPLGWHLSALRRWVLQRMREKITNERETEIMTWQKPGAKGGEHCASIIQRHKSIVLCRYLGFVDMLPFYFPSYLLWPSKRCILCYCHCMCSPAEVSRCSQPWCIHLLPPPGFHGKPSH